MNREEKNRILNLMIEYLNTLSGGTETTVRDVVMTVMPEKSELIENDSWLIFDSFNELEKYSRKSGLYLDRSQYDGAKVGLPCNIGFTVYKKKHGRKCPYCENRDTAKILYGFPSFTDELEQDLNNHRIALGGCCITPINPKYHCYSCGKDF